MTTRAIKTVRLVCWDAAHAKAASSLLREAGFRVVDDSLKGVGGIIGHFLRVAPDAVAIDLDRLPSQGREPAMLLRKSSMPLRGRRPACAEPPHVDGPRQSSRLRSDFNQHDVRAVGLAPGFVDYKVCAVDEDWVGTEVCPPACVRLAAQPRLAAQQ
jgi:hypothetical protein